MFNSLSIPKPGEIGILIERENSLISAALDKFDKKNVRMLCDWQTVHSTAVRKQRSPGIPALFP